MEEILAILFFSREVSHREHLTTDSYAQHMALGSFYEEVIELADGLAEHYQGCYQKKLGDIPYYSNSMKGTITVILKRLKEEICDLRKQGDFKDDSAIQNDLDTIETLFDQTIYKLTFLK